MTIEKRPHTGSPVILPTVVTLLEGTPMPHLEEAPVTTGMEVVEISLPSLPTSTPIPLVSPTQA